MKPGVLVIKTQGKRSPTDGGPTNRPMRLLCTRERLRGQPELNGHAIHPRHPTASDATLHAVNAVSCWRGGDDAWSSPSDNECTVVLGAFQSALSCGRPCSGRRFYTPVSTRAKAFHSVLGLVDTQKHARKWPKYTLYTMTISS